jgi:CheY-like chemotaxis protein
MRQPRSLAKPLILCVDDDSTQLQLRKAVLEENGFNVLCVTNVAEAVAVFRETPVCCTIADHMLQGETGVELAKQLKSMKRDVPIVLYSGAMPGNLQNIDVYINKDESTSGFLRIVREVVRRFCS